MYAVVVILAMIGIIAISRWVYKNRNSGSAFKDFDHFDDFR